VQRCDECGFVYDDHGPDMVGDELAALGPRYRSRLVGGEDAGRRGRLTRRPEPSVWSALEYACHVRDVLLAQRERLLLALVEDQPGFAPIYREERVQLARYAAEDPDVVARELVVVSGLTARTFAGLATPAWERTCRYNFPEPAVHDLLWLGQHTLHEGEHHLIDIDRVLEQV